MLGSNFFTKSRGSIFDKITGRIESKIRKNLTRLTEEQKPIEYLKNGKWISFEKNILNKRTWQLEDDFLSSAVSFDDLEIGLRFGELKIKRKGESEFRLVFIEIDPTHFQFKVIVNDSTTKTRCFIRDMVTKSNAIAAINASFFDKNGAIGLVAQKGKIIRKSDPATPGYFFTFQEKPYIYAQKGFDTSGIGEGIQCSPMLMKNGQIYSYVKNKNNEESLIIARRSVVANTYDEKILFIVTDTMFDGLSFYEISAILGGLGVRDALALDGGGSTQLYIYMKGFERLIKGYDRIPVALGVFHNTK